MGAAGGAAIVALIRAVIDVYVLISSVLVALGHPRRVLEAWQAERFTLVTSEAILLELDEKLHASRIVRRYQVTEEQIAQILGLLRSYAEVVAVAPGDVIALTGDPEDDGVLTACRLGQVDYLVTGDRGLRDLQAYAAALIITPRAFLARLPEPPAPAPAERT